MNPSHFPTFEIAWRWIRPVGRFVFRPRVLITLAVVAIIGWFLAPHVVFQHSLRRVRSSLDALGIARDLPDQVNDRMRWAIQRSPMIRRSLPDLHRRERQNSIGNFAVWEMLRIAESEEDVEAIIQLLVEDFQPDVMANITSRRVGYVTSRFSPLINWTDKLTPRQISRVLRAGDSALPTTLRSPAHWFSYIIPDDAIEPGFITPTELPLYSFVITPDGDQLVTLPGDQRCLVWDVESGEQVHEIHSRGGRHMDISPSGEFIALSPHERVDLCLFPEWDLVTSFVVSAGANASMMFNTDGSQLITWGDGDGKTVRFWDLTTMEEARVLTSSWDRMIDVDLSDDGTRIAAAEQTGALTVWRLDDPPCLQLRFRAGDPTRRVAFLPGGTLLTLEGHQLRERSFGEVAIIGRTPLPVDGVIVLEVLPDGKRALVGGVGSVVTLLNIETGEIVATFELPFFSVDSLALSEDGSRFAAGQRGGRVAVFDIPSIEETLSD